MRWRNRRRVRQRTSGRSNYNYFRDYVPGIGRYIESDPIGLAGGSYSTYVYANGSPISNIDPLGTQASVAVPAAIGIGVAALCYMSGACQQAAQGLENIYNQANSSAPPAPSATNQGNTQDPARQAEYLYAKNFCDDNQPPPTGNKCSDLSRQIDHAEACIALYQAWDAKWLPGRHDEKLQTWQNRVNTLKEEHRAKCTNKCP